MVRQTYVLTLDIGLTNCKATLFDLDGQFVAQAASRYATTSPRPGWSEQEPEAWWQAITRCVRTLLEQLGAVPAISAIGVTAHMHGLIAVDRHGDPLTPCLTLFDRRAEAEAGSLSEMLGPRTAYEITGARLEAYTPAAKILWLKRQHPALFERVALFLSPKDLVRRWLGGDLATDRIDAAGTLLYDLKHERWSEPLAAAVGARLDQLPEVRQSWAPGGALSREAADALGLPSGTPLVVGAGDDVEVLGAGVVLPGWTLEHLGTTGTMITCLERPSFDPNQKVEVYPHTVPGLYLMGGATNAAGRSLDWARRFVPEAQAGDDPLPLAYPPVENAPTPPLYLPYINGERGLLWEARATGAFLGLREVHTPTDLALGVYEGVAFSMKEILEGVRDLGTQPTEVVSGTPYGDPAWAQLRADMYGVPLRFVATPDPTALGTALLTLVGSGRFATLADAVAHSCRVTRSVTPEPERVEAYNRRFAAYHSAVIACSPLLTCLSSPEALA